MIKLFNLKNLTQNTQCQPPKSLFNLLQYPILFFTSINPNTPKTKITSLKRIMNLLKINTLFSMKLQTESILPKRNSPILFSNSKIKLLTHPTSPKKNLPTQGFPITKKAKKTFPKQSLSRSTLTIHNSKILLRPTQ